MSLFTKLKNALPPKTPETVPTTSFDRELFIYVKIPESIMPIDRGTKYEDPLDDRLAEAKLGAVSGGGSQLGEVMPNGQRLVTACGIDINVKNLPEALALLHIELPKLAAPVGTELHYTQHGTRLQDEYLSDGWLLRQPRTFLHPGFGC
ncbi:MAG: hypothetical protein KA388_06275 [Rhodocyclaceae bacterium]|nr:hypothetical protein [Rhodocyclaceae bacterium]MBK9624741.1 hypothetical protein [Rhodocyclaceae bacterium]MBL0077168.1 hypothetical protein [Rhodocyclaceae bacterium]MBP6110237.1 hypothetical protein [Rhodocyclaceae bacterium]MBP6279354.1 hypothetical protein [Rhodocyclaceae bacterium]